MRDCSGRIQYGLTEKKTFADIPDAWWAQPIALENPTGVVDSRGLSTWFII
jgi:hypothetical protein